LSIKKMGCEFIGSWRIGTILIGEKGGKLDSNLPRLTETARTPALPTSDHSSVFRSFRTDRTKVHVLPGDSKEIASLMCAGIAQGENFAKSGFSRFLPAS